MKIKAGTGYSTARDTSTAAREAATTAVSALNGEALALVLVFTTPNYDLPVLLSTIRTITGDALLIGSTSSGEIIQGTHLDIGAGVGVLALTAGEYRFGVGTLSDIKDDLNQAGQIVTRKAKEMAGASPYAAVLLFADSMLGDLQELMRGVYRITGPKVAIVGGAAGDDQKFIRPCVFHNDQVLERGAIALWIASDHPLQVVTRHGWKPMGIPLLVTRAQGTQIIEISGRPASQVYEDQLGLQPGELTQEEFWDVSIFHPFGLLQSDSTSVIRVARSKNDQGVLNIQGCVPPVGSAIQVMSGDASTLLDVVEDVVDASLKTIEEPGVLLAFSCAARAMVFRGRKSEEAQRLQLAAGDVPIFGVYCCGEFARTAGVLSTHNATLTVIAL
ncbi:MAG: FIST C-terminal domain-containing protein [Anaerolineales bacterium]|nr:FIST C-terminal domain-containing protein [Anaerolineales bacterium]